jgi:hypothetical protein
MTDTVNVQFVKFRMNFAANFVGDHDLYTLEKAVYYSTLWSFPWSLVNVIYYTSSLGN